MKTILVRLGNILLVCLILVLALLIVTPRFGDGRHDTRMAAARAQFKELRSALAAYKRDFGGYPESLQDLCANTDRSAKWKGPYLPGGEVVLDPWGNPFGYSAPGPRRLWSFGPDGVEGTEDDLYPDRPRP